MRVLFVTSEVAGLFKLGGLADVSSSLPLALSKIGLDVTIALPFYSKSTVEKPKCIGTLAVDYAKKRETVILFKTFLENRDKVPVILFHHQYLLDYFHEPIADKFVFFSKAVAAFVYLQGAKKLAFDIIHCNDWHTAMVPLFIGEVSKSANHRETLQSEALKTVFTIHNPSYQGHAGISIISKLGFPASAYNISIDKDRKYLCFIRQGIEYADIVTTVSLTFAKELEKGQHSLGLGKVLKKRRILGILNGIDTHSYDPYRDPAIHKTYSARTVVSSKKENKLYLQKILHLPEQNLPLFGFIGRLDLNQKGIEIFVKAVETLLPKLCFQVVVLGVGDPQAVSLIRSLEKKNTKYVRFLNVFDLNKAREMYAGCDVMVVPSRFEPCGLIQMIAQRYGTIPLVRKTGGLADTVKDNITGFVFDNYSAGELRDAIFRVISVYNKNPVFWQEMVMRIMSLDLSWSGRAKHYFKLYSSLL